MNQIVYSRPIWVARRSSVTFIRQTIQIGEMPIPNSAADKMNSHGTSADCIKTTPASEVSSPAWTIVCVENRSSSQPMTILSAVSVKK